MQILDQSETQIQRAQKKYFGFREQQKQRLSKHASEKLSDEEFWKSTSEHAPETRVDIATRARKNRESGKEENTPEKRSIRLFSKDGRPLNINQAKVKFHFDDCDPSCYVLDIAVYK